MFLYLFQIWMATLLSVMPKQSKEICSQTNTAFNTGEKITYTIFYNVIGLYVHAGDAQFAVSPSKWEGEPALALTATGNSNRRYDWIFKVRDRYESYIDTLHLQPIKFVRHIEEGTYKKQENILFNQKLNTASGAEGVFKIPNCVQDVVSSIYYLRNIDFNKYNGQAVV